MQSLLNAARRFPQTVSADPQRYAKLAAPQHPEVLLITCSDSRVVPEAILGSGPGEVFELRNAGGIVPAYTPAGPGRNRPPSSTPWRSSASATSSWPGTRGAAP